MTDDHPEGAPALFRFWGHVDPRSRQKPPLLAQAPDARTDGSTATLRLHDPIDSYGEFWGVSAKEFAGALDALPEGTSEIRLHINSPGGEVHEGLAILNALRAHPARVVAVVDGLAASAASFIATGADELVMGRNTELMIHDAWGVAIGPAEDLRQLADRLDSLSANIASIYAEKAGGELDAWREAMRTETWYSAQEAVDAGLADSVLAKPEPAAEPAAAPAKARWDYTLFAYAGRAAAPAPTTPAAVPPVAEPVDPPPAPVAVPVPAEPVVTPEPAAPAVEPAPAVAPPAVPAPEPPAEPGSTPPEMEDAMADLKEGLASRLGVEKDVDDDTFLAALDEALNERADVSPAGPAPAGYTLVPTAAWSQAQTAMAAGVKAQTDNVTTERERILADARDKGRILPHKESLASWRDQYDRDPAGTTAYLAKAPQIVPVAALGYAGGAEDEAVRSEKALNAEMASILGVSVEEFSRG